MGAIPLDQVEATLKAVGPGPKEGIGRGVIEAPPERVFRALIDFDHWDEFMPFLKESDARPQPDGSVLSSQRLAFPSPIGERHFEIRARTRVDKGAWMVEWSLVPRSGNIRAHRGSWVLKAAAPGTTLAVLHLYTDLDDSIPDSAMNRATRGMLGWTFKGLRQQVQRWRYVAP